jgi:outer membrane usher protein
MRWLWSVAGKAFFVFALAFALGVAIGAGRLRAGQEQAGQGQASQEQANHEQRNLQLEVFINDIPVNSIGSFVLFGGNRIGATRNELEELGLRIGARRFPQDIVMLDDIPVRYQYDERTQKIRITVDNADRQGRAFDLSGNGAGRFVPAQSSWGALLNYDLLSTTGSLRNLRSLSFSGTSLALESRTFSPYGTFEQSGLVRVAPQGPSEFIRLGTTYRYSDQERMITYRAGDAISGGLAWSRPVRIGGLQSQSNFALRPDLITAPLPTLGGTAAVPSTVDVYVNSIKTFSQDIGPGPFSLNNVPLVSGAGNAQLVIRDSSGHETRTSVPFYASPILLAPGLSSWSIEAGLPRLSFGSTSDAYVQSPVGAATLRRGIFDWLTLEAHAEGGAGTANGGVGAVFRTGIFGVAEAAVSGSTSDRKTGVQTYVSYETQLLGFNVNASSQRTFGTYDDLASATARLQDAANPLQTINGLNTVPSDYLNYLAPKAIAPIYLNARTPRALDRITVSAPLWFDIKSSLSTSFLHMVDAAGLRSDILTASWSRSLPYNASIYATAFQDFGTNRNSGVFVGLSVPLSEQVSASTGASRGQGGSAYNTEIIKPLGPEPGSYGWRVRDSEGASPYREASAAYRSRYGTVQVGASQDRDNSRGLLELRGSIATMGGGVFLSNWIDDGFAVISTGAARMEVRHDNRAVGVTDGRGMLLVPTLRSYQNNKITIDPSNLPVDAEIASTREVVVPADRAGVMVKFNVRSETTSALVTFTRPGGEVIPAGAVGRIDGGEEFIVGYDGQAFVKNLSASNAATIELIDGTCRANFAFAPRPGEQVQISPVECR